MRPHRHPRLRRIVAWTATLLAAAACQDGFRSSPLGPSEEPPADLNIIALATESAPPDLAAVSFYAHQGQRTRGVIRLADQPGIARGREYLRLTIPKDALLTRPDGSPIAPGDSVLITIRVADPARVLFEMEPAGLRFNPSSMPELRIRYDIAAGDLNHDGRRDAQDDSVETHLGIWRQPAPGSAFVRLESEVHRVDQEVRANLPGFSRYAIAY
jgi:hypothetical protein